MKSDEDISNALGIEYKEEKEKKDVIPFNLQEGPVVKHETTDNRKLIDDEVEDYHLARNNLHNLINVGNEAMSQLSEVAKGTEHPRAYEVLANIMKTLADTSKDLYDIQEKTRAIKEKDNPRVEKNTTNINVEKGVFVGSASELLKSIEEDENKKMKTIENKEE